MSRYVLTKEGEEYATEGLPEIRLVKILDKPLPIASLQKNVKNFSIAFQWAKKNGWVEIKNGNAVLVKKAGRYGLQEAITALKDGKSVQERLLKVLVQRKLAEESKETKKPVYEKGQEVREVTEGLIKSSAWKDIKFVEYNVEAVGKRIHIGKRQPYSKFLYDARKKLIELGFIEVTGSTIVTEFWNFDALFQPQGHPSRDWTQTYSLKYPKQGKLPASKIVQQVAAAHENGWKTGSTGWGYKWSYEKAAQLMPVAHDTAVSPQTLASKDLQIPGKYFQIVRCFRPDVIDVTHGVEFNQMGGFVVAEDLTFKDLLGLLKMFAVEIGGCDPNSVRFFTDYYPFTEPSAQVSAKHPKMGWVELAGAGIFREELTKPLGVDAPVIAWGFGIDRLAMHKLGISDIRYLFSQNLKWLRNQVV
ncbi:MAG: phenylalanine--tRNA ligase subunit alpha [Candidatus Aenigmarchaeota archaeon]|nr:phenylalanine--tRNA ligase subunit alpha [Candidatus Aenigmarchaeota archaeon]